MSRIPQTFIDDLLSRLDIVDVIDRRVKLKKAGKNYSACCPFHDEKTPSFTVSPDKQFYYCFGCGANGNAIGFIMEYERQSFVESIENLASMAGLEVPKEETSPKRDKENLRLKRLYQQLKNAREFFETHLRSHPKRGPAVKYLKERGLTGQIAKSFGMGLAPPGWDHLLKAQGQTEEHVKELVDCGLVIHKPEEKKTYDRFRDRIMFPIHDVRGRVIGFGGRVLGDEKPKYLNSPETDIFRKGKELYGLYEARKNTQKLTRLIVVEGYMDVIALNQFGITNAVATLGTACGEDHLKLAFRFVEEVVFCFDGDAAGRNAAKRALTNSLTSMKDGRQIRFLFLTEGQDPDTLVRQIGQDRFLEQIDQAIPLEDFLFDVAAEDIDISSMEGRARFSKIAAPLVGKLPEGIFRELMFDNLAKRTGLSPELLRELQKEHVELVPPSPPTPANETGESQKGGEIPSSSYGTTAPATPAETMAGNSDAYATPADEQAIPYAPSLSEHMESEAYYELHQPPLYSEEHPRAEPRLKSQIRILPDQRALILLLNHPGLLKQLDGETPFPPRADTPERQQLLDIIEFIKRRPNCNFNNIMGFWAGAHGVEAQQALVEAAANDCFGDLKRDTKYDPVTELSSALSLISSEVARQTVADELKALTAKPWSELTDEEKKRVTELIQLNSSVKTPSN